MRRYVTSIAMTFALVLPCSAQGDKAKPNTLTPKESADGWILLFDGETTFGWLHKGTANNAKVKDHVLDLSDLKPSDGIRTTTLYREFELHFEYYAKSGKPTLHLTSTALKELPLAELESNGVWTPFEVRVRDTSIEFKTTGIVRSTNLGHNSFIGFTVSERTRDFKLRNIKLKPADEKWTAVKSLFNGKDLTGWKTFPGDKYKSKFSVNDKGELNVKDGPGDLQTVGKYKDFILQLECISNGKHLNSGIFFRCRDNEYQNGYEAQIRNQFTAEPTQKYVIEEYDPKTNKLLGKKEILSTAFDFGTGSIYRRIPARKEMSKDGEWFAMTIVAQDNHFATWVNGVQVTDWTDNRPKTDNARTGCKLEAGHLSIQGHDPTTDLSFRNLRIAEIK